MAFPCFQLLYMTLAINKLDGCGLVNIACYERLPKKTEVMWLVLATEVLPERLSVSVIKVRKWANA